MSYSELSTFLVIPLSFLDWSRWELRAVIVRICFGASRACQITLFLKDELDTGKNWTEQH